MRMLIWKRIRMIAAGSCACIVIGSSLWLEGGTEVYGAESSVIESVSVTFKSSYGEAQEIMEPEITASGTGYTLEDFQYGTDYEKWKPGKKVRVEITLAADEGKVFPTSLTRSKCKISGADFVSAKGLEDNKLQVKVDYKPVMVLGNPAKAGWSSSDENRAVWKAVEYAPGYSLVLYGDNKVVKRLTVTGANIDLSEYMKDIDKTYYYEVKAIPTTADEKKYLKEGEFVSSTEQEFDWEEMDDSPSDGGGIKGNNYILPDGRKDVNTWKKISNQWYYFDQNGNMAKGWQFINGFWYYMDQKGVMKTGWVNPSGDSWYFLTANGDMLTGWIQPEPSAWYYTDASGCMQRGWVQVNGKWYYLGTDGRMLTGWQRVGDVWYYFYQDGSMAVNTNIEGWNIGGNGAAAR